MKLGVALPIIDIGREPARIREFAQAAKEIGYQGLALADHVLGVNPTSQPEGGTRVNRRAVITTRSCCSVS